MLRAEGRLQGPDTELTAVGRDKKVGAIEVAQGDRIRFGENLPQFRIRNGTRGTIERIESTRNDAKIAVRLEDGRLINEAWASLVRQQPKRTSPPPRISHAYAGTAYSVQSRTAAAAVLYLAKPTDARETYVGLTRHLFDARIVAERDRLQATIRQRQSDIRIAPSETAIRERLFSEARTYADKANVADYVEDRIDFMRNGQIEIRCNTPSLNLSRVTRATQRTFEAAWDQSSERALTVPVWRLVGSMRHILQQVSKRVAELISAVNARIEARSRDRSVVHNWDRTR